jgi:hypothetical protein
MTGTISSWTSSKGHYPQATGPVEIGPGPVDIPRFAGAGSAPGPGKPPCPSTALIGDFPVWGDRLTPQSGIARMLKTRWA